MNGDDAFGGEMGMIRTITEDEQLAAFARTLCAELLQAPTGADAVAMPVRLAEAARASREGVELRRDTNGGHDHAAGLNGNGHHGVRRNGSRPFAARRRVRGRFERPLLRLAAVVVAIPALFTGLAFAGVELPAPAEDAFEAVGIELPNQSADDDVSGAVQDGVRAGPQTGPESSPAEPGDARTEPSPADGGAPTESNQVQGEKEGAIGEPGLTPETPKGPDAQADTVGRPVSPPAGAPESPGNSSGNIPDDAGPGAGGGAGVLGPLFSPDEESPPQPAKP